MDGTFMSHGEDGRWAQNVSVGDHTACSPLDIFMNITAL
jgi:hypothetical protein